MLDQPSSGGFGGLPEVMIFPAHFQLPQSVLTDARYKLNAFRVYGKRI